MPSVTEVIRIGGRTYLDTIVGYTHVTLVENHVCYSWSLHAEEGGWNRCEFCTVTLPHR